MARRRISNHATETLTYWLNQFQEGALHLGELPLAVEAYLHLGYALGRESRQPEVDQLEHEANILWMQAYTPKERHAEYQRRLDEHFRFEDQRFFDACSEPVQDGNTTIDPATNAEIEGKDGRDSGTTGTSRQAS